jgi:cytosine/adenosine deaminase-related metal-dependent hydrolase
MILRAKWVVPVSQPPIENGAVAVEGGEIVSVGPVAEVTAAHGGETRDLGEVALSPGLINAHCHLDYTGMVNQVPWRGVFLEWILHLVRLKQIFTEEQYLAGIQSGIDQLLATGTTTVVNIEAFPGLIDRLPATPLRIIWCPELIDFKRPESSEQLLRETLDFIKARQADGREFGLSPHAPYTASGTLYRLAARYARGHHLLCTTHLAESTEEDDMFRRGSGPLYDYFLRSGRDMSDCKRLGVVQLLNEMEVLTPGCLVAHANCLTQHDMKLLADSGAPVAHCPKTHRFFERGLPLVERLMDLGVNICLGTDSLASNDTLNMLAEMQEVARVHPRWSAEQILPLATTNAAQALGQSGRLGRIAVGAKADLMAVPANGGLADPYEAIVFAEKPVNFVMINGKVVRE